MVCCILRTGMSFTRSRRSEVTPTLQFPVEAIAGLCRRYQVRELGVFGSAARGEMREDSDIDLLVEFIPGARMGLFELHDLEQELTQVLGRKVDLVSKAGLKPRVRDSVLRDLRILYAA